MPAIPPAPEGSNDIPTPSSSAKAITQHIQGIVLEIVQAEKCHDWPAIEAKCAPDFRVTWDNQTDVDFSQRLQLMSRAEHPDYFVAFADALPEVGLAELKYGSVRAYLNYEIHGAPPGVVVPGVLGLVFRFSAGRWLVSQSVGMRLGGVG